MKKFIPLKELKAYKLARELSKEAWVTYSKLSWQDKKIAGDQFMRAIDSIGANIAEGYLRFHYLDKIKFYYVARASLSEGCDHWLELLCERGKVREEKYIKMKEVSKKLAVKLNNFINSTYNSNNSKRYDKEGKNN